MSTETGSAKLARPIQTPLPEERICVTPRHARVTSPLPISRNAPPAMQHSDAQAEASLSNSARESRKNHSPPRTRNRARQLAWRNDYGVRHTPGMGKLCRGVTKPQTRRQPPAVLKKSPTRSRPCHFRNLPRIQPCTCSANFPPRRSLPGRPRKRSRCETSPKPRNKHAALLRVGWAWCGATANTAAV